MVYVVIFLLLFIIALLLDSTIFIITIGTAIVLFGLLWIIGTLLTKMNENPTLFIIIGVIILLVGLIGSYIAINFIQNFFSEIQGG